MVVDVPCSVLIIVVADSGEVHAVKDNVAVSFEVLSKILKWKQTGASQHDALKRLRLQTVPTGYTYTSWNGST